MPILTYTPSGWVRAIASEFDNNETWKTVTQVYCMRTPDTWEPVYDSDDVQWITGTWSGCSATCGGGTRNRPVSCQSVATGATIADSFCDFLIGNRPASQEVCNTTPCSQCFYQVTGTYGWVYAWVTKEAYGTSELWWNGSLIYRGTFGQPTVNIGGTTYVRGAQQTTVVDPDNAGKFFGVYQICFAPTKTCRDFLYTNQGVNLNTMVDGYYHVYVNSVFSEKILRWNGQIIHREVADGTWNPFIIGGYKYTANTSGTYTNVRLNSTTVAGGYGICRETTIESPIHYCPNFGVSGGPDVISFAGDASYATGQTSDSPRGDVDINNNDNSAIYWHKTYVGRMNVSGNRQQPTRIGNYTYYIRSDYTAVAVYQSTGSSGFRVYIRYAPICRVPAI